MPKINRPIRYITKRPVDRKEDENKSQVWASLSEKERNVNIEVKS